MKKKKIKSKRLEIEDDDSIKTGDGILAQMEKSSTVYKADKLTSEKMEKMLKDMWDAVPVDKEFKWETYTYATRSSDIYSKPATIEESLEWGEIDDEIDDEIIEKGVKTQILFGIEGYEIVDGKITRALTIDEINKLKDE